MLEHRDHDEPLASIIQHGNRRSLCEVGQPSVSLTSRLSFPQPAEGRGSTSGGVYLTSVQLHTYGSDKSVAL